MKNLFTKFLLYSLVLFILISFNACESSQVVEVRVLDLETSQPIDSVLVEFKAGKNDDFTKSGTSGFTDSTGSFIGNFMIGCAFGCYDFYFECSKSGYQTYISELNVNKADVLLLKE